MDYFSLSANYTYERMYSNDTKLTNNKSFSSHFLYLTLPSTGVIHLTFIFEKISRTKLPILLWMSKPNQTHRVRLLEGTPPFRHRTEAVKVLLQLTAGLLEVGQHVAHRAGLAGFEKRAVLAEEGGCVGPWAAVSKNTLRLFQPILHGAFRLIIQRPETHEVIKLVVPVFPIDARFLSCDDALMKTREVTKKRREREADNEMPTDQEKPWAKPERKTWIERRLRDALASHHIVIFSFLNIDNKNISIINSNWSGKMQRH